MLADQVDHIIGVDTHKDSHTIAVVSPAGAVIAHTTVPADTIGHLEGYRFAVEQAPGRRVWAIEGAGSYGAGLTAYLLEQGEWVAEIDRPARPARRTAPRAMTWTLFERPARRSAATTWPSRAGVATGRPSACC
jgi:transposase